MDVRSNHLIDCCDVAALELPDHHLVPIELNGGERVDTVLHGYVLGLDSVDLQCRAARRGEDDRTRHDRIERIRWGERDVNIS